MVASGVMVKTLLLGAGKSSAIASGICLLQRYYSRVVYTVQVWA